MKSLRQFLDIGGLLTLVNGLLVIAIGGSAAYWTWALWLAAGNHRADRELAATVVAAVALPGAREAVAAHFFGQSGGVVPAEKATATSLAFKLVGTMAGFNRRPAVALIVNETGKPVPFVKGAELAKGVTVREIGVDYVLLQRDGQTERLNLTTRPGVPADSGIQKVPARANTRPARQ